ncbi:MAG: hypothetical protein KDB27_14265 [Planctomycetales bacterium]|nr:hypothetical protein [Planctomycetales bacterium]
MATGTTTETFDPRENDYDRFILQQIERTQSRIRITELATLVLTLAVGTLGFFLLVTIVDHWIYGMGFWGRLLSLVVLVGGGVAFFVKRIVPFLVRSINPIYAAQTIEQSTPNAKNGLINFLLLRDRPQEVRASVFEAVQKRAATDLSNVEIDLAVDRTTMIRLGYAFAVLVAIAGAYKILSPKDPVATVARVISPWQEISRPARVQISEVTPGDITVYRGESVTVTASIAGLNDDDSVVLIYSTEDGQIVDAELAMSHNGDSIYTTTLGESHGLQQPTVYKIHSGDAESAQYRIDVKESPSIDVARVDYEFPKYTELVNESTDVGDIRAVEGTKIVIRAEANQPVASAYLEFVPGKSAEGDDSDSSSQLTKIAQREYRTLRMRHAGTTAEATFVLQLQADRKTPEFTAYRVRFTNRDGERNDRPVLHQIDVTPDLTPLVDILAPNERDVELPVNRSVDFELRGVDPDFKLSDLSIRAATGGNTILRKNLLEQDEPGQVVRKYRFNPEHLALKPGMSVLVWAVVSDNRRSPKTGQPDPNVARTENYRVRVVAPERTESPEDDDSEDQPERNNQADENTQPSESDDSGSGGTGGTKSDETSGDSSESNEQKGHSGGSGTESESDPNSPPNENAADGGTSSADSGPSDNGNNNSNESSSENNRDQNQSSDSSTSRRSSDSLGQDGQQGNEQQEPVASDGTNDPDAFERILDHMNEKGQDPEESPQADSNESGSSQEHQTQRGKGSESDSESKNDDAGIGEPESNDDSSGTRSDSSADDSDKASNQSNDEEATDESDQTNASGGSSDEKGEDDASADSDENPNGKGTASDKQNSDRDPKTDKANGKANRGDQKNDRNQDQNKGKEDDSSKGSVDADGAASDQNSTSPERPPNGKEPKADGDESTDGDANESQNGKKPSDQSQSETSNNSRSDDNGLPSDSEADSSEGGSAAGESSNDEANADKASRSGSAEADAAKDETDNEVKAADKANLEYAKKATDMAIDYLKNHKDNRELLDKLGWTEDEADEFLKRWQKLKNGSADGRRNGKATKEWNDSLKSLGLKPKRSQTKLGDQRRRDVSSNSIDTGRRSKPPASYAEQFRAYLKETDKSE